MFVKKKIIILWSTFVVCCCVSVQAQIDDPSRVYDIVTDSDTFYLFSTPKPCFDKGVFYYAFAPTNRLLQEYITPDTVTVYGVAITFKNYYGSLPINDTSLHICLYKSNGPSFATSTTQYYEFTLIDTVTLNRSHPRFCQFLYEDRCDKTNAFLSPCYEFYFDTPQQINRMTDTFYVGRRQVWSPGLSFVLREYGARYDNSLPAHIYMDASLDQVDNRYVLQDWYDDKRWGWAFPIIGFRCGPIQWYNLDSYTGDSAVVRWRSVEEGTVYNVRLVGEDGSDTTYITSDTTFTFTQLSDSVRYNVMLRKQCHYATSNYDTTVYGQWRSNIYFGTTILPDTTGGDTVGIVLPDGEPFSLAPNPAQGSVQVVLPKSATGGELSLCDLTGRELMVRTVVRTEMELDISTLPTGTYLVKLTTPQGVSTKRLVVAR